MLLFNKENSNKKVAGLLKTRRLSRNITQAELAERSGVPLPTLRRFEQTGEISLSSFLKLLWVSDGVEPMLQALKENPEKFKTMDELLKQDNTKKRQRARKK